MIEDKFKIECECGRSFLLNIGRHKRTEQLFAEIMIEANKMIADAGEGSAKKIRNLCCEALGLKQID